MSNGSTSRSPVLMTSVNASGKPGAYQTGVENAGASGIEIAGALAPGVNTGVIDGA